MDKKAYFENMTEKICKLLKIYPDVFVQQDNRLKNSCASIDYYIYTDTKEGCYLLRYNAKEVKFYAKWQIIQIIFHELAHLVLGHCKDYCVSKVDREYRAEKLGLLWIKIYYPNYYKRSVNQLKKYSNYKIKLYREAYTQLWKELHETNTK